MNEKHLPLVSVIVPSYNMEEYIAETLDSVLNSTYGNIEIIVVDDGSRDKSLSIATRYAENNSGIKVFSQANSGVSVARNLALRESSGEYILPLDADDKIESEFIAAAVEAMERDSDVKAVTCRCVFFGNREGEWNLPDFNLHKLATDNRLCASSMYRRSDAMRAGGYNEEIIAREDWEFWISLLKNGGRVVKLPLVGFHYRVRANSKRFRDRNHKVQTIDFLNRLHPEFFERELGGRLHNQRSRSKLLNRLYRMLHPRCVEILQEYKSLEWYVKALPRMVEYVNPDSSATQVELLMGDKHVVVKNFYDKRFTLNQSVAQDIFEKGVTIDELKPIAYYAERHGLGVKSYCVCVKE